MQTEDQNKVVDSEDVTPLLSLKTCEEEMELVKRVDEISTKSAIPNPEVQNTYNDASAITTENVFEQCKDLFEGLGCLPGEHKIKLKMDAVPVAIQKQLENLKVMQPVKESTE